MTFNSVILNPNRVAREVERAFDEFAFPFTGAGNGRLTPRVNVLESEKELILSLAIPGVSKEEVKVVVQDDVLTISGERKFNKEEKTEKFVRREFHEGSFSRSFTLPNTVDAANVKADYKNGILEVRIPKREEAKPREVEVKVS